MKTFKLFLYSILVSNFTHIWTSLPLPASSAQRHQRQSNRKQQQQQGPLVAHIVVHGRCRCSGATQRARGGRSENMHTSPSDEPSGAHRTNSGVTIGASTAEAAIDCRRSAERGATSQHCVRCHAVGQHGANWWAHRIHPNHRSETEFICVYIPPRRISRVSVHRILCAEHDANGSEPILHQHAELITFEIRTEKPEVSFEWFAADL